MALSELGKTILNIKPQETRDPFKITTTEPATGQEKLVLEARCKQIIERSKKRFEGMTGEEFYEFAVNVYKLIGGQKREEWHCADSNPLLDSESGFKITVQPSLNPHFKIAKLIFEPIDPNNNRASEHADEQTEQKPQLVSEEIYFGVSNAYPPSPENKLRNASIITTLEIPHQEFSCQSFVYGHPETFHEEDTFTLNQQNPPSILPAICERVFNVYTSQSQISKAS